jgi:hypothetical protein
MKAQLRYMDYIRKFFQHSRKDSWTRDELTLKLTQLENEWMKTLLLEKEENVKRNSSVTA